MASSTAAPATRPMKSRNSPTPNDRSRAAVIFQKGEAEAKAMNVKAEAYQEWTQAAVVDKLISNMAEVVRAMAEPLAQVDKITIVSTGDGDGVGASKLTGDLTRIAAQVPALFEALSGMKMSDLMNNVKGMEPNPDGKAAHPPAILDGNPPKAN